MSTPQPDAPLKLVTGTGVALHFQVKAFLLKQITEGRLAEGDRLPPELEIVRDLMVSRATVRQAVLSLVTEGLLVRRQGKGTFVTRPKVQGNLQSYLMFRPSLNPADEPIHHTLCQRVEEAGEQVATALEVASGTLVIHITRIRVVADEPVCLEYFYVPHALCPDFVNMDVANQAVADALRTRCRVPMAFARTTLDAVALTKAQAEHLSVRRGTPGLLIRRVFRDQTGRPVLYTRNIAVGCQYHVEGNVPDLAAAQQPSD